MTTINEEDIKIPHELMYNDTSGVAPQSDAKADIYRYRADNQVYKCSQQETIRIEIPTGSSNNYILPKESFIEGYVQTTASGGGTAGADLKLDRCVYSLFKKIRIMHGSVLLEEIDNFNRLMNTLIDIQTRNPKDTLQNGYLFGISLVTTATPAVAGAKIPFCFAFPSAILGYWQKRALPLRLLNASSLYIELILEKSNICLHSDVANTVFPDIEVSDVRYNAKILQLSGGVNNAVMESIPPKMIFNAITYRSEFKTIVNNTSFSDKFAFNVSSAKLFMFFLQNGIHSQGAEAPTPGADATIHSISKRVFANIDNYILDISGQKYPSSEPINTNSRMYFELLRAFNMLTGELSEGRNSISRAEYISGTLADNDVHHGSKFVGALDLDRAPHGSGSIMSGLSTIGQTLSLNLFLSGAQQSGHLYAYMMHDILYEVVNGLLQPRY